jgi:KTSC domain
MAKLIPVESSMIQAVGYDSKTRTLEVVFNSGRTYCYEGVPSKVYKELMAADSKGQYMRAAIIDVYPDYPVSGRRRRR